MLIAGHDTSTALLAWVLFLLGSHPQWMAQMKKEVDAVLTSASEPPTAEQLNRLQITDQVIKEALRLYPPIHVGNRFAKEDVNLQGYRLPAGTRLMCSIYLTHRDKNYWPEPEQFRPERFERSQEQKRPPLAYVPFGGGPRNCIGAAFAQVEAKVVLGRLLQCFDFELLNAGRGAPVHGRHAGAAPGGDDARAAQERRDSAILDSASRRVSAAALRREMLYFRRDQRRPERYGSRRVRSENERPQLL